jgi:hypothetical protein
MDIIEETSIWISLLPSIRRNLYSAFRVGYVDASGVKVPAAQRIARPLQHGKNEFLLMMTRPRSLLTKTCC